MSLKTEREVHLGDDGSGPSQPLPRRWGPAGRPYVVCRAFRRERVREVGAESTAATEPARERTEELRPRGDWRK